MYVRSYALTNALTFTYVHRTYRFFRRCGSLLQKLSASSESFFRRSFPHLRKKPSDFQKKRSDFQKKPSDLLKKPSDLRRSCAANASPEKCSEGRCHFLRRVPYVTHCQRYNNPAVMFHNKDRWYICASRDDNKW